MSVFSNKFSFYIELIGNVRATFETAFEGFRPAVAGNYSYYIMINHYISVHFSTSNLAFTLQE